MLLLQCLLCFKMLFRFIQAIGVAWCLVNSSTWLYTCIITACWHPKWPDEMDRLWKPSAGKNPVSESWKDHLFHPYFMTSNSYMHNAFLFQKSLSNNYHLQELKMYVTNNIGQKVLLLLLARCFPDIDVICVAGFHITLVFHMWPHLISLDARAWSYLCKDKLQKPYGMCPYMMAIFYYLLKARYNWKMTFFQAAKLQFTCMVGGDEYLTSQCYCY